ncbi:MAG: FAD-binding oxidoreductase [Bradyrhizobium sp.]|uniref:FAD-binding oxidoreductase n=1 Tax=Bradyrhizobium sp. TaxID=376 RepID=UPI002718DA94|nr:FAD-binding oxidoreductase [Bradyrhizobium sp.]MDO8396515.1 FAD-binding oxidoreductase [Bradyrhizobium sp.]
MLSDRLRPRLPDPPFGRPGLCGKRDEKLHHIQCSLSGEIDQQGKELVRPESGPVLMCRSRPRTDLQILPKRIESIGSPVRKTLTARVFRRTTPAPDVSILTLRFPIGVRAKFKAGQYLKVLMPDGDSRNFSMANPPHQNDGVELHIRHVPGGLFSEQMLPGLAAGSRLRVELPFGDFYLRSASELPVVLLASGTGFAPIKSIVENAIRQGSTRPMSLYWGARTGDDIYLHDLPAKWQGKFPWFSFIPVLSEAASDWSGRTGLVHRSVLEDFTDLSCVEVYACGNPLMIAAAQGQFSEGADYRKTASIQMPSLIPVRHNRLTKTAYRND